MRTVIADYKDPDPTTTSGSMNFWKYFADIKNISNMYPYGKSYGTNAIYNAADDYRYGFNGMEKAKEVDENTLTTQYRNADLEFNNWWSRDPKESEAPSNSPYIMMGNNPIVLIDPNGDKEYKSIGHFRKITGFENLGPNDWLITDRELMSETFANANEYNLLNRNTSDYTEINQRYAFYEWFQNYTDELGYETKWAGAAAKVAYDVEFLTKGYSKKIGSSNEELSKFAKEGNEAIFVDVFPKLRKLYLSSGLQGEDARSWDFMTLSEEQHLVQPLYNDLESKSLLKRIINGRQPISPIGKVFTKGNNFPSNLDIFTIIDRWKYGIQNMGYLNFNLFKMPNVSDYYKNGGSQSKSEKGSGKLDTPLAPAKK